MLIVVASAILLTGLPRSEKADSYIRHEMEVRRIPGLALAVVKDGKVVKRSAYGFADLEHRVRVTPESEFELASLTKQFTATAIMLLAEDGKLSIDDDLSKHLTDAPSSWKGVKLRHLLTHTAGFASLNDGFKDLPRTTSRTTAEMYENIKSRGLQFVPGSQFAYSDEGYFLLGMVIEKGSGIKYADFLRQRIFQPLGMTTASVPDLRTILPHRVRGYTIYKGELINIMRQVRNELAPHFGIFATIDDLIKWENGLSGNALLPRRRWTEAWTEARLNDGSGAGYGFGWNVWNRNGTTCLNHTGITGTEITRFNNEGVTVIILTNLGTWGVPGNAGVDPYGMTQRVAEIYVPKLAFKPVRDPEPDRSEAAKQILASMIRGESAKGGTEAFTSGMTANSYFHDHYGFLGELRAFVPVEIDGNEVSYKATFEKGDRFVAVEFENNLVGAIFPIDA